MANNTIRFAGLASGLDTESIVKNMVMPYKIKADSKKQEQTMMEWRKDAWKEMNSRFFGFYDKYVSKLRLESTFNKTKVSSSNPNIIEFDKNVALPTGTHELLVCKLATGTRLETKKVVSNEKDAKGETIKPTASTKIAALGISFFEGETRKVNLTINKNLVSEPIEITREDTIGSVVSKLKQKMPEYNVSFDEGAQAFFISSKKTGINQEVKLEGDYDVLYKLGMVSGENFEKGKTLTFKMEEGTTLEGIIDITAQDGKHLVKNNSGETIGYMDEEGNLFGYIKDAGGNTLEKRMIPQGNTNIKGKDAQNAEIEYNGVKASYESNTITINGLNMTVKAEGATTLVSTQDSESIVNFVKEFVDEYNKLIEDVNRKLVAPSTKEFRPLTEEQKKDMSDKEVEAWEQKIKDSLFRNNETLKTIMDSMRQIVGETVKVGIKQVGMPAQEEAVYMGLSDIGITTGDWREKGKLHVDEDKLKSAIGKDVGSIIKLFSANGSEDVKDTRKGIGDRLYDKLSDITKSTELRSKYSFYNDKILEKEITRTKEDYLTLTKRMERMESMYYKQFTAMEKMMQSLNSQSSWLSQQLGGM
ncbi:MAG: flagellar filament capping protein FliD [Cellulosilyticaceae bacterium]